MFSSKYNRFDKSLNHSNTLVYRVGNHGQFILFRLFLLLNHDIADRSIHIHVSQQHGEYATDDIKEKHFFPQMYISNKLLNFFIGLFHIRLPA